MATLRRAAAATPCLLALALGACESEPLAPGVVVLVAPADADPFAGAARVRLLREDDRGTTSAIADVPAPYERVNLDYGPEGPLVVEVRDDEGAVTARGRSLSVDPRNVVEQGVPILVAPVGRLVAAPGDLSAPVAPTDPVAIVGERFVVALTASRDGVVSTGYDLGEWAPLQPSTAAVPCPASPCRPRSMAVVDFSLGVLVGDDFGSFVDFDDGSAGELPLPDGLASWRAVAGGRTVTAPDGTAYIVGATRADGDATSAVLRISVAGEVTAAPLTTARRRAAAAWLPGRGLLVAGGSRDGAGAELLPAGSGAFVPLNYPPDPIEGAAVVPIDDQAVARLGGRSADGPAPTVRLEVGCGDACALEPAAPEISLDVVEAVVLDDGTAVVQGTEDGAPVLLWIDVTPGAERAAALTAGTGGRLLRAPTGHGLVVGGNADARRLGAIIGGP